MLGFHDSVRHAETSGAPAVEGFSVALQTGADPATAQVELLAILAHHLPDYNWAALPVPDSDWITFRPGATAPAEPPLLSTAWEVVRKLEGVPGVAAAEPQLLTRMPLSNGTEARRAFELWGKIDPARLAKIQEASNSGHMLWSLDRMNVCNEQGQGGAWKLWREKHGADRLPGEGVLVAHPDTGYHEHPLLIPSLATRPEDPPQHHGRNFVERDLADALTNGRDPMVDRSFGNFPGHGTSTASIISCQNEPGKPWSVAPGARIIPLRVSSTVVHFSFQNVCDAFLEAMARGAQVISMSLGGPFGSGLLNDLVKQALDQGIIIVSAAGNYVPTVAFPARIPGVIGCAGSNVLAAPWRFSGLGERVAITAPAELVWHQQEHLVSPQQPPVHTHENGDGTSFATANVAGLAALWLSFWREELQPMARRDIPHAFRLCLEAAANKEPKFIKSGRGGFGAGLADAEKLLREPIPANEEIGKERERVEKLRVDGIVNFPVDTWGIILTLPTLKESEAPEPPAPEQTAARLERIRKLLDEVVGAGCDEADRKEIGVIASTDDRLLTVMDRVGRGGRDVISAAAVRRYLRSRERVLSTTLNDKLKAAHDKDQERWNRAHPELALPAAASQPAAAGAFEIPPPPTRRLRAYAYDPSLATQSGLAAVNEIVIPVVYERDLQPGPVGDYLEVVDVDPASDCAYAPVDLNHPYLLAQDGLQRSEGNPQFHQQMVYAVAMNTIAHFEQALGRPLFWSPLRGWREDLGDHQRVDPSGKREQFVRRLRLYPHALREQNAYYSPQKRAILFGYFPAGASDPGREYPGGVVFSCLSYDIIAHEMTHAILDGMHVHFTVPSNPDVFAFHEAFADIVALFQRFTYRDLLRSQIARARGQLGAGTLMSQLAIQFGNATGRHQALRDALGYVVQQQRSAAPDGWIDVRPEAAQGEPQQVGIEDSAYVFDEEARYQWKRYQADPSLLAQVEEPHARGTFLVAAVFDAFLCIYEDRIADLKRIATGGTGVLPDGEIHPDLVNRMADEAAKSALHVLRMCIRAMDYVPPTDITLGDFLRALITADADLVPDDPLRYRVAFIEAFRKWGIYPRDVRTLSEETLRWSAPDDPRLLGDRKRTRDGLPKLAAQAEAAIRLVRRALLTWRPGEDRERIFEQIKLAQWHLHTYLKAAAEIPAERERLEALLGGIDLAGSVEVTNLRPARRIGPNGEFRTEMVVEVMQTRSLDVPGETSVNGANTLRKLRGGVTLIVDLDELKVRYAIHKRLDSDQRAAQQREFMLRASGSGSPDAAEYSSEDLPDGWFSNPKVRAEWEARRLNDPDAMRASSCACRRTSMEKRAANRRAALNEPFAFLHRG